MAQAISEDSVVLMADRWSTSTPEAALDALICFAGTLADAGHPPAAAGMTAFGPLIVDLKAPDCGLMLATAKSGWTGSNMRADLARALAIPVAVDTDVNAAATAELVHGAAQGCPSAAYLTVGTGIGAGLAAAAGTLQGALHPEIGHLRLVRHRQDQTPSTCPYHSDCAEGLAAGLTLTRRLGPGEALDHRKDVRALAAYYLAQLIVSIVLAWSPHRIVIGGGVGASLNMVPAIRDAFGKALGGYRVGAAARSPLFLQPAALEHAVLTGDLLLAGHAGPPSKDRS